MKEKYIEKVYSTNRNFVKIIDSMSSCDLTYYTGIRKRMI